MSTRYLKHVPTGQIFAYQSNFATDPSFVEVADHHGTALPDAIDGEFAVVEAPKKTRAKKVTVVDDDISFDDPQVALDADASRGL